MSAIRGLVTDSIAFSAVDGPGNRFVVFTQGCNFNCIACHNPYTINVCNSCGECVIVCPSGALTFANHGKLVYDDGRCHGSDQCVVACPFDSAPKARVRTVDDVLTEIRAAAPFISGVTASGGEPTQQAAFVYSLFTAVKDAPDLAHLSCFVDSNGSAETATWEMLAPVIDGAMVDLKCLDPAIHRSLTGWPNERVLESIRHLHSMGLLYEVRLLLIPGWNDDAHLLRRTAAWLAGVDPTMRIKLIGFRGHGVRPHTPPLLEPAPEAMDEVVALFRGIARFDVSPV